jgi:dTDP-4-dehydrorhamnose 3,5-epimerase
VKVIATELAGVLLIEPTVHRDARGFFLETWHEARYREHGVDVHFVQDNHSRSTHGTLRGLHAQLGAHPQAKLVRCVAGEIFDVAVDVRVGSPTFGRWVGERLSADNFRQLYLPVGFAHGFCVTSETAEVEYKCSAPYAPQDEIAVAWNDPAVGIRWPVAEPRLSSRDAAAPRLAALARESRLPAWRA